MRTNYFDDLIGPTCPSSKNKTGAAANPRGHDVTPLAPLAPLKNGESEKNGQTLTNYGKGYRHPDGRVETGQHDLMPRPTVDWPADLTAMLRRVATAFEWSDADRRDFITWSRRSPDGLADARAFLETEAAKLPKPGLSVRA